MNSSSRCSISKRAFLLLVAIGFILIIMNSLLIRQNEKLKARVSKLDRSLEIKPGKELPPLEGIDINGDKLAIAYGEDPRKTLLLVFSPNCRFCKENIGGWHEVLKRLDDNLVRVIGISINRDGAKEFAILHKLTDIPVMTEMDAAYRVSYNLNLVPQMILIGADGRVERVWTGKLADEEKLDLERSLNS